ncbi:hypothetical protein J2Z44_001759 [Clostridium punense]|uniref:Class IIb bacteriocin, lactobin A/cerein 7B family n=1 Tax=Clostridium punense TaxID=1054297 RepID=A0ABS4K2F6_9CLOT|nr:MULTISPECIES: hypothetical protein [Clostridium]EQB90211.1 hypothetical protein M918_01650 [Clostridium sp. BL8]MBP2021963.1 hypothetical protein [Clostridium punense]
MADYQKVTGFVSVQELEEVTEVDNGAIAWVSVLATAAFTVKLASAVVCETGACTGYCN